MKRKTSTVPVGRLVTLKDGALELGLPYTTLRDRGLNGEIPVCRIGRSWYLDRRDIEEFIRKSKAEQS